MLAVNVAERRIASLRPLRRPVATNLAYRRPRSMRHASQNRTVATLPGKPNPDNMGGPAGQESFPASAAIRRQFMLNTVYGVVGACTIMMVAKLARWNSDPNATYVLVHDSTKGELDDVKYIKATEVPKERPA